MIKIKQKGDFSKLDKYLHKVVKASKHYDVEQIAITTVEELKKATPKDTGLTAESWKYEIIRTNNSVSISFYNTNIQNGITVAFLLEYDHGTANGGWVQGKEYIGPTIQTAYNNAIKKAWKEITKL